MNKYKNTWLNNQYIAWTKSKIECPFCLFWMAGKELYKKSDFLRGRLFICNNKKCDFFFQFFFDKETNLWLNCDVGYNTLQSNNSLWLNYKYSWNDLNDLLQGPMFIGDNYIYIENIKFDLSNLEKFLKDLELFQFYT